MNDDGKEVWAMVPESVLLGDCDDCVRLFGFLDLKQGARGRPFKGIRALQAVFGWHRPKVRIHLDHLEERGLVTVEKKGNHKAQFRVHNPARGGYRTRPTSGYRTRPTPLGTVGTGLDPLSRSYRYEIGLSSSDFELSEDDEVVEIRDVDMAGIASEIAIFESANGNGSLPVREPEDV